MSPVLPVVSGAEAVRALAKVGFVRASQRGSHVKLRHEDGRVAIVPLHKRARSWDATVRVAPSWDLPRGVDCASVVGRQRPIPLVTLSSPGRTSDRRRQHAGSYCVRSPPPGRFLGVAGHRVGKRRSWPGGLTSREIEILRLLARGLSNKQIASRLTISAKTASSHVEHICISKIGVSNRAMASLYAAKHGLITVGAEDHRQPNNQGSSKFFMHSTLRLVRPRLCRIETEQREDGAFRMPGYAHRRVVMPVTRT